MYPQVIKCSLSVRADHKLTVVPPMGWPLVKSFLLCSSFDSGSDFLAVRINNVVLINVYLPTDYRDVESERLFAISMVRLAKCLENVKKQALSCVIVGEFNCDLTTKNETPSSRVTLLYGLLDSEYILASKNKDFSYIHNSRSTSNIDQYLLEK